MQFLSILNNSSEIMSFLLVLKVLVVISELKRNTIHQTFTNKTVKQISKPYFKTNIYMQNIYQLSFSKKCVHSQAYFILPTIRF